MAIEEEVTFEMLKSGGIRVAKEVVDSVSGIYPAPSRIGILTALMTASITLCVNSDEEWDEFVDIMDAWVNYFKHSNGSVWYDKESSPREVQVLEQTARGLSHKEIARELWMADETCRTYQSSIRQKLELHSMTACVVWALANGKIDFPKEFVINGGASLRVVMRLLSEVIELEHAIMGRLCRLREHIADDNADDQESESVVVDHKGAMDALDKMLEQLKT